MIDLTPLDVRKKKGDFHRTLRGYDPELVDDFLDMVAERLEELVKQNVSLTERAERLEEQIASFREREKALNEALVTAQQLRAEAEEQAKREAQLVRREAEGQAELILEEGRRSLRSVMRDLETLSARKRQFIKGFRALLERYLSDLEVQEEHIEEEAAELLQSVREVAEPTGGEGRDGDWLGSILGEAEEEKEEKEAR